MSESERKKLPEWGIFDRLSELEDITLKLMEKDDTIEPTLKNIAVIAEDARIIAKWALTLSAAWAIEKTSEHRQFKDELLKGFMVFPAMPDRYLSFSSGK